MFNDCKRVINVKGCVNSTKDTVGLEGLKYITNYYRTNWIKYNNNWYFKKDNLDYNGIINELVGSYLARCIGLPTVKYEICFDGKYFSLMSLNHMRDSFIYKDGKDFTGSIDPFLFFDFIHNNYGNAMMMNFFKVFVLDYYMGQYDRHYSNLLFKYDNGKCNMDLVYDFACSFRDYDDYIKNDFIYTDIDSLRCFANADKSLVDVFNTFNNISLSDVFKDLESFYDIVILDKVKSRLDSFYEKKRVRV